ncbi:ABC transporter substrate-binding protein [Rouxiella sp. Mn2063]|uniref:ABC transporter substrate-binding protein n=1 Tax=Rouxiella sp. Mn2063 TaxID=3395262 RepID=UPI003BC73FA5
MKKLTTTLGAVAVLLSSASTLAATIHPETLTIGSDLTYPPYNYTVQGKPAGFDAEFMQLLAAQLKLKPQVIDTRFASLILGIKMHKFDVVASTLYVTPERAQQVNFIPYMKTGGAFLVKADSKFAPQKPEDLCGKKVSSIKGGAWIPRLAKVSTDYCLPKGLGAISVREFPTSPEATQAVLSDAVDVQYEDAAVAKDAQSKTGNRLKITSTNVIYPVVVGMAFDKDSTALQASVQGALNKIEQNGSYAKLLSKYNVQQPDATEVQKALAGTL